MVAVAAVATVAETGAPGNLLPGPGPGIVEYASPEVQLSGLNDARQLFPWLLKFLVDIDR